MQEADERFPPSERLRGSKAFDRVYETGEVFKSPHIVLFCLRENGLARKVGFVASRKVGRATARNRARRRLREAYRKLKLGLPGDALLVFVARKGINGVEWEELLAEMASLLSKAGLKS